MMEKNQKSEVMAILTMFVTYARPIETMKLLEQDLAKPPLSQHFIVNLHSSMQLETSKVNLTDQSIELDSKTVPYLGDILDKQKVGHPSAPLIKSSYPKVKKAWEDALVKLGLGKEYAVMYQIRHTGPSWDRFKNHRSILDVKNRGGWRSNRSLKRYENHALVASHFAKLPAKIQQRALTAPSLLQARLL